MGQSESVPAMLCGRCEAMSREAFTLHGVGSEAVLESLEVLGSLQLERLGLLDLRAELAVVSNADLLKRLLLRGSRQRGWRE